MSGIGAQVHAGSVAQVKAGPADRARAAVGLARVPCRAGVPAASAVVGITATPPHKANSAGQPTFDAPPVPRPPDPFTRPPVPPGVTELPPLPSGSALPPEPSSGSGVEPPLPGSAELRPAEPPAGSVLPCDCSVTPPQADIAAAMLVPRTHPSRCAMSPSATASVPWQVRQSHGRRLRSGERASISRPPCSSSAEASLRGIPQGLEVWRLQCREQSTSELGVHHYWQGTGLDGGHGSGPSRTDRALAPAATHLCGNERTPRRDPINHEPPTPTGFVRARARIAQSAPV